MVWYRLLGATTENRVLNSAADLYNSEGKKKSFAYEGQPARMYPTVTDAAGRVYIKTTAGGSFAGFVDPHYLRLPSGNWVEEGPPQADEEEQGSVETEFMGLTLTVTCDGAQIEIPPWQERELFSVSFEIPVFQAPVFPPAVIQINVEGSVGASMSLGGATVDITSARTVANSKATLSAEAGAQASLEAGAGVPVVFTVTAGAFVGITAEGSLTGTAGVQFHQRPENPITLDELTLEGTAALNANTGAQGSLTLFFWNKTLFKKTLKEWTLAEKSVNYTIDPAESNGAEELRTRLIRKQDLESARSWSGQAVPVGPEEFAKLPMELQERLIRVRQIKYAWGEGTPEEEAYLATYKHEKEQALLATAVEALEPEATGPAPALEDVE